MELTVIQKEKLKKLEQEIVEKHEYDKKNHIRKQESSQRTGIPYSLIDMDVIKIGTMLGLLGEKKSSSLLNMFLNDDEEDKFSPHFQNSPQCILEIEKIEYQKKLVEKTCTSFANFLATMIKDETANIEKFILISLETANIKNFISVCVENMEIILDEITDDEDEMLCTLSTIRNALLGALTICEYKTLVSQQINILKTKNISTEKILTHLSWNDDRISLYLNKKGTYDEGFRFLRELYIRSCTKSPELKRFNFNETMNQCCVPSLMSISVKEVINFGLVGPYSNNSIGFLNINDEPWSFFIIQKILPGGTRLWVLDYKLEKITEKIRISILNYQTQLFKVFYQACFGDNKFRENFWESTQTDVFKNMFQNFSFLSDLESFHKFITSIILEKSCLIPTQYDFFNCLKKPTNHPIIVNQNNPFTISNLFVH